jgi:hypothetical protein
LETKQFIHLAVANVSEASLNKASAWVTFVAHLGGVHKGYDAEIRHIRPLKAGCRHGLTYQLAGKDAGSFIAKC